MPKKILVGTDVMVRGGVDTYTIDLVKMALDQGWQVEVVVDRLTTSSIPQALADLCPIYKGPLYHRRHDSAMIEDFYSSFLQKRQPDLVHLSCGIPWGCLRMREITLEQEKPLLFTEHYIPPDISFEADILKRLIKIYRDAKGVIHVSKENLSHLHSSLPLFFPYSFFIIPNGINWKAIQKRSPSYSDRINRLQNRLIKAEKIRLLAIARLTKQKGIDLLIEAIRALSEDDKKKVMLDIWGEGPELRDLQDKIINDGLSTIVQLHPWSADVLCLFSTYDLLLFPSRYEGLPFTLLEALASGISIIASNIPVHQWITQKGCYAFLFQNGDSQSLTKTLKEWLKEPLNKNSQFLYEDRFRWLEEHFSKEKNINNTLKVWEQLTHE